MSCVPYSGSLGTTTVARLDTVSGLTLPGKTVRYYMGITRGQHISGIMIRMRSGPNHTFIHTRLAVPFSPELRHATFDMASHDGVEITPSDLKFRFQLNKQLLGNININNTTDKRVAFKIKTTAPKKYVVRPSSGVTDLKSSASVQVIMQAQKDYPLDFQASHDDNTSHPG